MFIRTNLQTEMEFSDLLVACRSPSLLLPISKAALLFIFSGIVLVYLRLKATVQGSAEIIREPHSVSSVSAPLSVSFFYLLLSSFVHRLDWVVERQVDKG